jgi:hypothetical protein
MENQQHLLDTVGPMYVQAQAEKAAQEAAAAAAPQVPPA